MRLALLDGLVDEHAVLDGPAVLGAGIGQLPAVEVLAVEQRDWLAELDLGQVRRRRQGGNPLAGELSLLDADAVLVRPGSASVPDRRPRLSP